MKNLRIIAVGLFLTAIFSASAFAQVRAGNKVFVIDTGEFANPKGGITKFVNAFKQLEDEMKPQTLELENLAKKIQTSAKQYQTLKAQYDKDPNGPVSLLTVKRKGEDIERMQLEYKRKEEDVKLAIAKREKELFDPIRIDIYKVMGKYAKEKNYPIILDLVQMVDTKLVLAIGDNQVDLTEEFITYYNSQAGGTAK